MTAEERKEKIEKLVELKEAIRVMMAPELSDAVSERIRTLAIEKIGPAASAGLVGGICCNGVV